MTRYEDLRNAFELLGGSMSYQPAERTWTLRLNEHRLVFESTALNSFAPLDACYTLRPGMGPGNSTHHTHEIDPVGVEALLSSLIAN